MKPRIRPRFSEEPVVKLHTVSFHSILGFIAIESELRHGLVGGLRRWRLTLEQSYRLISYLTEVVRNTRARDATTDDSVVVTHI